MAFFVRRSSDCFFLRGFLPINPIVGVKKTQKLVGIPVIKGGMTISNIRIFDRILFGGPWHKPLILPGMAYNYGKLTKDVIAEIFPPAADPWLSTKNTAKIQGKTPVVSPKCIAGWVMKAGSLLFTIFTSII